MSEPFLGQISLVSFNYAPRGYALCNGQFLPINQNQALFSLLGTTYGGNGQTTFALPDLRGRAIMHFGNGFTQGERAGEEFHTLTISEMPQHNHGALGNNTDAVAGAAGITPTNTKSVAQGLVSQQGGGTAPAQIYGTGPFDRVMSPSTIGNTGGGQPHENRQPFTVMNYIIALQGIFPSRN